MKRIYKKLFGNTTFQNIELINPRYFGVCWNCDIVWLLHRPKSLAMYFPEWICPHCKQELDIRKLKKRKSLFDMQKQIIEYRKQNQNILGIFK